MQFGQAWGRGFGGFGEIVAMVLLRLLLVLLAVAAGLFSAAMPF